MPPSFSDDVPGRLSVKPLLLAVKTCLNVIGTFRWINRMHGNFVILIQIEKIW